MLSDDKAKRNRSFLSSFWGNFFNSYVFLHFIPVIFPILLVECKQLSHFFAFRSQHIEHRMELFTTTCKTEQTQLLQIMNSEH